MKCPKCGYLGFDTGPRCRNCSYDFALLDAGDGDALPLDLDRGLDMGSAAGPDERSWLEAIDHGILGTPDEGGAAQLSVPAPAPLAVTEAAGAAPPVPPQPVADVFDFQVTRPAGPTAFDLPDLEVPAHRDPFAWPAMTDPFERAAVPPVQVPAPAPAEASPVLRAVRTPPSPGLDEDAPLVQLQRPRAPVAVRKTPMSPKLRAVTQPKFTEPELDFLAGLHADVVSGPAAAPDAAAEVSPAEDAPAGRRLAALVLDGLLFGAIDLAVLYLTLRIVGLETQDLRILPVVPMLMFLGLMKFAYAAVFTAMGGQTIGKMAMHIRVVSSENRTLSGEAALRRTLASLVSVVTAGLGYLPGLVGPDRRAVHDRLAGSRVVTLGAA